MILLNRFKFPAMAGLFLVLAVVSCNDESDHPWRERHR